MGVALGSAASGVFTNSSVLWDLLHESGKSTGDRVWRMPLFEHYKRQVADCHLADLNNIGGDRMGGACTAAAFLRVHNEISAKPCVFTRLEFSFFPLSVRNLLLLLTGPILILLE